MSEAPDRGSIGAGIWQGFVVSLMQPVIFVLSILLFRGSMVAFYVGLTQLVYIGPAVWLDFRKGKTETGKGLLIFAAIVALLNGICVAKTRNMRFAG